MTDEKNDQLEIRSTSPIIRKSPQIAVRDDRAEGGARIYYKRRAGKRKPLKIKGIILMFSLLIAAAAVLFFSQSNPAESYARQQGISPEISEMLIPLGTGNFLEYNNLSENEKKFIHCLSQVPQDGQLKIIGFLEDEWGWHIGEQQMSFTCTVKYFDDDAGAVFIDDFLEDSYISGYETYLINCLQNFHANYLNQSLNHSYSLITPEQFESLKKFTSDGNLTIYEMNFTYKLSHLKPPVRAKVLEVFIKTDKNLRADDNALELIDILIELGSVNAAGYLEKITSDGEVTYDEAKFTGKLMFLDPAVRDFFVENFISHESLTCSQENIVKFAELLSLDNTSTAIRAIENYASDGFISYDELDIMITGGKIIIDCPGEYRGKIIEGLKILKEKDNKSYKLVLEHGNNIKCCESGDACDRMPDAFYSPAQDMMFLTDFDLQGSMPYLLSVIVHEAKHAWQHHTRSWEASYGCDVLICTEIEYEAYIAAYDMLKTVYPDYYIYWEKNIREYAMRHCEEDITHKSRWKNY